MEPFLKKEEITTTSQLVGTLPGDPPRVNLVDFATGRNGVKRHFTRQVPVLDKKLFARLQGEVAMGEHIRATVMSEYRETGSIVYLTNFQKANDTASSVTIQTGRGSLVQNSITEIAAPSRRSAKVKA